MRNHVLALAALAAAIGFAGAAYAAEATHPGKAAGPVAISDSELDGVTAGSGNPNGPPGLGVYTAANITSGYGREGHAGLNTGFVVGFGTHTAVLNPGH
jgi:hypothetical protein